MDNKSDTVTLATLDNTPDSPIQVCPDNTSDTLTLARMDRENQGPWEFEYSYGGEFDLHQHFADCQKNPGHKNFIPVDKFSIEDLPEDYKDNDVVDYIRAVSDLTVRVSVTYVSDKRPATVPGSHKKYPGYSVRGRRKMTVGTGWVVHVAMGEEPMELCKCKECRNSSVPQTNFAIISFCTASHVVFDDIEVEHTTCHLFFDKGVNPKTCTGVVTLTGMSRVNSDVNEDICSMDHYTHDLDLAGRLHQILEQMDTLESNINEKLPQVRRFKKRLDVLDKQPLLFIVSHPHGCSKHISLGRFTSAHMINNIVVSMLYNTATCPGSSGARVSALNAVTDPDFQGMTADHMYMLQDKAHCAISDVQHDINCCRATVGYNSLVSKCVTILPQTRESGAGLFSCRDEEDHNQLDAGYEKNPGQENLFPVEKFIMDNLLPSFYQRDDVIQFIKLASDLTVPVSVKYVSEDRPATVPGTDIPYPWSSNRGSHLTRVGNGWVEEIHILKSEKCTCKECNNSANPKPWAYIELKTAVHLVYDKLEAEHTTCHLFFDPGETRDACTHIVTLADVQTFFKETDSDTCSMSFLTHDLDLVNVLEQKIRQCKEAFDLVSGYDSKTDGDNAKQELPLHIVFSHPLGRARQVSICCCSSLGSADREECQCSHSCIVCPGSCGAPVIDLSRQSMYPVLT